MKKLDKIKDVLAYSNKDFNKHYYQKGTYKTLQFLLNYDFSKKSVYRQNQEIFIVENPRLEYKYAIFTAKC